MEVEVGKVKEEVEEKVVEEKVEVAGAWLKTFLGNQAAGPIMDMPWDGVVLVGPHPPGLDRPLLLPAESPVWTLRFVTHRVRHKILRQGRWV